VTVNAQICQGQSYWAGGALQTTAGIYIDNLVSSNGCDSVITTNLTVVPAIFTNLFVDICQGDSIFAGGAWQTAAGVFTDSLLSSGGCDSIIVTTLNVNPIQYSSTPITICDDQLPYTWNGQVYTTAGTFVTTLTTLGTGCDSIAELVLTVNPTVYSSTPVTICDDQLPFSWNGQTYTAAGIYSVALTTLTTGCDSIAELVLTVNPTVFSTTQSMLCDNQLPYTWNGQTYTAAGIYSVTLTSLGTGCDSIAELVLTVNPTVNSTTQSMLCDNQLPYTWNGQTYTAAGSYSVTLTALTTGCDSIAELVLTVNPTVYSSTPITICDDQLPYNWNGQVYTIAGTYVTTLTTVTTGCDSIAELVLTVNPTVSSTTYDTICDSQLPYAWNGQTYISAGNYDVILSAAGTNCDSIATLFLTVLPTSYGSIYDTVCDNALPYVWNGTPYTVSGTYYDTLINSFGCDSIVSLNLHISPTLFFSITDDVCDNNLPYMWNGLPIWGPGLYTMTFIGKNNCDSTVTLNLIVNPVVNSITPVSVCNNQLPYVWNGNNYANSGIYYHTLSSITGCDSVARLDLTVYPVTSSANTDTICDNDLPYAWNGLLLNTGGNFVITLSNSHNCDSVTSLHLVVNPSSTSTTFDTICDDALPYSWNGNNYTSTGIYSVTLINSRGCDSVASLNLTVNPVQFSTLVANVCDSQLPFTWNGQSYTNSGVYSVTFSSLVTHCDSISTLQLTVIPTVYNTITASICQGDSIWIAGAWRSTPGNYTDQLMSALGCDSILTTQLFVFPNSANTAQVTICQGDSWWAGNGLQTTAGVYHDTLLNSFGCDSILTTVLTVNPLSYHSQSFTICQGDSIFAQNTWQLVSGVYYDTLTSYLNCDSIITTTLNVIPTVYFTINASICQGNSYYAGGALQTTTGLYYDTLVSTQQCDSIVITDLVVHPIVFHTRDVHICQGDNFYTGGNHQSSTGIYVDTLVSSAGCDSILTTNLTVHPRPTAIFSANPTKTSIRFPTISFTDGSLGAYFWNWNFGEPASGASNFSTLQHPTHEYLSPGFFNIWLTVTDTFGCQDSTFRTIEIEDMPLIYVPNAFTPDHDGLNDIFIPKGYGNDWDYYEFSIYNRMGQLLFKTNDIFEGWDGMFLGELSPQTVYAWKVVVRHKPGSEMITLSGTVTLLR
jgi:gliding motility-associated-like protein